MAKQPKPKASTNSNDNRPNKKAHKKGTVKHRRTPLDALTLVIMGKGSYQTLEPIKTTRWRGTESLKVPFDKVQSEKNRLAGYWS